MGRSSNQLCRKLCTCSLPEHSDYRRSCSHRQCRLMDFAAFFGNSVSTFFATRPEAAAYRNTESRADPPGQGDSGKVSVLRDRKLRYLRALCRLPCALWTPRTRLPVIRQHASAVSLRATGPAADHPLGIPQSAGDWRQLCASDR